MPKLRLELALFIPLIVAIYLAVAHAQPTGSNTNPANVVPAVTFAQLPTSPAAGAIYYMTDGLAASCADTNCTTYGTNVTGGAGALKLLIWWNGAHWTTIGK